MSPSPTLDQRHAAFGAARRAMLMAYRDWILAGALIDDAETEESETATLMWWIRTLDGMP